MSHKTALVSLTLGAQRFIMNPMATTKAKKVTKASGRNVEEWERGTERLTLRLKPEVMQLLYSLATEVGEPGKAATYAKVVEQALHALDREMNEEAEENEEAMR